MCSLCNYKKTLIILEYAFIEFIFIYFWYKEILLKMILRSKRKNGVGFHAEISRRFATKLVNELLSLPRSNMPAHKRLFTAENGDIRSLYTGSVYDARIRKTWWETDSVYGDRVQIQSHFKIKPLYPVYGYRIPHFSNSY